MGGSTRTCRDGNPLHLLLVVGIVENDRRQRLRQLTEDLARQCHTVGENVRFVLLLHFSFLHFFAVCKGKIVADRHVVPVPSIARTYVLQDEVRLVSHNGGYLFAYFTVKQKY